MKKHLFTLAFALGLLAVVWVAATALGGNPLVLLMTGVIGLVFAAGARELQQFRQHTQALAEALQSVPEPLIDLGEWLARVPEGLRQSVRQRVEGERAALPGPALTPYLVGLLVMLGMLGTFLGMVTTLSGAAFALQGVSDIQGIRSAFSEPIKGLGLAFGASVAGVATSAMLGLMSTLVRRERLAVAQGLDQAVATRLRGFSLAHQRQETYRALQQQSQTLPAVAAQLQQLMAQMAQMQQQLGERLTDNQERFHREARETTQALAQSVDQSLRHSLTHSMQLAGDSLRPVVQAAMDGLGQQAQAVQASLTQNTERQIAALAERFGQTTAQVAERWQSALATHERSSQDTTTRIGQALDGFAQTFEAKAQAVLASVEQTQASREAQLSSLQTQQLQSWQTALQATQAQLQQSWQDTHAQQQAQQAQVSEALTDTARELGSQLQTQTTQTLAEVHTLVQGAEDLMRQRVEAEAQWLAQHQQRSAELAEQLRSELGALRQDEAQRGQAAIERLGQLEAAMGEQLARTTQQIHAQLHTHATQSLADVQRVVGGAEDLMRQRIEAEAQWLAQHQQRSTELAEQLRSELGALREDEAQRGQAAIERLGQLEAAMGEQLARTTQQIHTQLHTHATQSLADVQRVVGGAEDLMRQRVEAEAQWLAQHQQRSTELAEQLRSELGALRTQEDQRGQAAVARLGQLEAAVAEHLTRLGTALEAPLARLIETATEAPKAAAEVIAQLRGQISASVVHDNALLQERTRTLETLNELLSSIRASGSEQREVIDSLVGRSQETLAQAGAQFSAQMGEESGKLADLATEVRASAIEVASLGESFGLAVRTLHESHEKVLAQLQQIEAALSKSMARSDEQLAYYVAQAREVIDLSLSSQKDVLDALSRASAKPALALEGSA